MDCVNHSGVTATSFCQNCGKALCGPCVRTSATGQILCEPCMNTWQAYQQPFVPAISGSPNPSAAAVLGLIPGVGAMYNGQFFKGLIHVVIFAVLVSLPGRRAGFAEHLAASSLARASRTKRLATILAEGCCRGTGVVYAVHVVLLSRRARAEPPDRSCRAGFAGDSSV